MWCAITESSDKAEAGASLRRADLGSLLTMANGGDKHTTFRWPFGAVDDLPDAASLCMYNARPHANVGHTPTHEQPHGHTYDLGVLLRRKDAARSSPFDPAVAATPLSSSSVVNTMHISGML